MGCCGGSLLSYVCVCVCVRAREGGERGGEGIWQNGDDDNTGKEDFFSRGRQYTLHGWYHFGLISLLSYAPWNSSSPLSLALSFRLLPFLSSDLP